MKRFLPSEGIYRRLAKVFLSFLVFSAGVLPSSLQGDTTERSNQINSNVFTVTVSFPKPPKLHHLGDWQAFESIIIHSCSLRLVRNRAGQVLPDLAESWSVSPDERTIVFKLRKDAVFTDGSPIEARHAAHAISRHIALNGQYADSMRQEIVGAEKIHNPKDQVSGIEVTDKRTLTIKLAKPAPEFFSDLGMLSFSVFRERDVSPTKDVIETTFAASGPYKISSFKDDIVVLERNHKHWDKELLSIIPETIRIIPNTLIPDLDRLLAGELDVARADASSLNLAALDEKGIQRVPTGIMQYYLDPDFKGPTFSSFPQLVRLLNIALDRNLLVAEMEKDKQTNLIPISAFTGNIESLDKSERVRNSSMTKERENAKNEIRNIAEAMRKKGIQLKFAERSQNPLVTSISTRVRAQLNALGIPVVSESVTPAFTYRNKRFGEFDLYINREPFDTEKPLRALKFIIGTDAERTNISPTHPVFEVVSRKPQTYEEHLKALRDFNAVNEKTGFAIPVFTDRTLLLFSNRINTSRVTRNDFIWHPADVSIKKE